MEMVKGCNGHLAVVGPVVLFCLILIPLIMMVIFLLTVDVPVQLDLVEH